TKTKDESSDSDAEGEGSKYEGLGLDDEGHGLEDEGHGLEDEGPGLEEEEDATPEGQWQVVLIMDTAMDELFGLGYEGLRHRELALGEGLVPSKLKTPPSPEWSSGSMPVLPSSLVVLPPIASPMTTPEASILVDDDQFLERANHDLRRKITEERHERLELTDRVARMERRQETRRE
nr:hypothetical protein [Tanacetum cinerariifolium]